MQQNSNVCYISQITRVNPHTDKQQYYCPNTSQHICGSYFCTYLIKGIKDDNQEIVLSQFADDTTIILDGTEESLQTVLGNFHFF